MATIIDEIRGFFEACGYDVSERVGLVAGEVDRFATQRRGLMPPRTWWTVVETFPSDLGSAVESLDRARSERGADRALAIVTNDATPDGYRPDLNAGVAIYVTLRYLALHLTGIVDQIARTVQKAPRVPYFPHRVRLPSGETIDACRRIEEWIALDSEDRLVLSGSLAEIADEVVQESARRLAGRFLKTPEQVVPIVDDAFSLPSSAFFRILELGWIIMDAGFMDEEKEAVQLWRRREGAHAPAARVQLETLIEPTVDELMAWFRTKAPEVPRDDLHAWLLRDEPSRTLVLQPAMRKALLEATSAELGSSRDAAWLSRVLDRAFRAVTESAMEALSTSEVHYDFVSPIEDAALRDFALGHAELLEDALYGAVRAFARQTCILVAERRESDPEQKQYTFRSRAARDWFLARKIAREVRAGDRDLLTRYNFPREHVLLFLAVIAPDVTAALTADRAEDLRHEIESQVERQVQLTLGHQLNRSIGAIGSNLKSVHRALEAGRLDENARIGVTRIEEELAHLRRLTERSLLLYESEPWELTSLPLAKAAAHVLDPLREQHPEVMVHVDIPSDLVVRAVPGGLHEILHCLVENGFHSVCAASGEPSRRLEVYARRDGETVRVRVTDNGDGVRPDDRERIFKPFVTTKKGGTGRPRGTGLGLPIARKFAERMGARVVLESSNGSTVFVVLFVAGGPHEQE